MKKYRICQKLSEAYRTTLPTQYELFQSVRDTNPTLKTVTFHQDIETMGIFVICENKPRDLPIYGVKWVEEKKG